MDPQIIKNIWICFVTLKNINTIKPQKQWAFGQSGFMENLSLVFP